MAADDLPRKFDVIVVGTGLRESILAAAFARVGYSVLHIDRNGYYCGDWASYNLHDLEEWCTEQQTSHPDPLERPESADVELKDGDILVECPLYSKTNRNIETGFLVGDKDPEELRTEDESTKHEVGPCGDSCTSSTSVPEGEPHTDPAVTECTDGDKHSITKPNVTENSRVSPDSISSTPCHAETNKTEAASDDKEEVDTQTEMCQNDVISDVSTPGNICSTIEDSEADETSNSKPADEESPKVWTKSAIQKEWRKFNIDLAPRLLYCRGDMVELLINSDVSKYCEFKTVTRVLTKLKGELQKVPCSRADVFSSKSVSMIEKRMMMKFITFCMDYEKHPEEYSDFADKPFTEFLDSRKLKPNIRHYIQYSIAMATDTTTTLEGLANTQKFILSLGRYGNTAFLWPLYGSGELPQSFARMCAVFGGIYCLRMTASSIIVDDENKYRGIVTTEGHRIESKWLITETSYLPKQYLPSGYGSRVTSRAVLLTDKSIQPTDSEQLSLLHLPSDDDSSRPVTVMELGPSSMACPQELYMVHLSRGGAEMSCSAREDLQYTVDSLFSETSTEEKPSILWYLYFSQSDTHGLTTDCPQNIVTIPGPGSELDMDHVVKQARDIFTQLCPDEEFLPKAPNPEDIIFDDGMSRPASEGFAGPPVLDNNPDQEITDTTPSAVDRGDSPDQDLTDNTPSAVDKGDNPDQEITDTTLSAVDRCNNPDQEITDNTPSAVDKGDNPDQEITDNTPTAVDKGDNPDQEITVSTPPAVDKGDNPHQEIAGINSPKIQLTGAEGNPETMKPADS